MANVETGRDENTFLGSGCDSTTSLFSYFVEIWAVWRARWLTAHDEPSRRAFERLGKGLGTLPRSPNLANR